MTIRPSHGNATHSGHGAVWQQVPDENEIPKSLSLWNDRGEFIEEIDRREKLNMLVFWASWCGPCRTEIPQLKELYERLESTDLSMTSISIDENQDQWLSALKMENMPWIQTIVSRDSIEIIKATYNFSAIPLTVFTDENGMELKRFEGYAVKHTREYVEYIENYLKSL